jgi:hypothetical protein
MSKNYTIVYNTDQGTLSMKRISVNDGQTLVDAMMCENCYDSNAIIFEGWPRMEGEQEVMLCDLKKKQISAIRYATNTLQGCLEMNGIEDDTNEEDDYHFENTLMKKLVDVCDKDIAHVILSKATLIELADYIEEYTGRSDASTLIYSVFPNS